MVQLALNTKNSGSDIGVLFGCFGRKIDGPSLAGGLIIYQGNPSISSKRTPMGSQLQRCYMDVAQTHVHTTIVQQTSALGGKRSLGGPWQRRPIYTGYVSDTKECIPDVIAQNSMWKAFLEYLPSAGFLGKNPSIAGS